MVYLHGVPWTPPPGPVGAREVDVVGYRWQTIPAALPPGVRLTVSRRVDGHVVARFSLTDGARLTAGQIADRAPTLLGPAPSGSAVLVQSAGAAG